MGESVALPAAGNGANVRVHISVQKWLPRAGLFCDTGHEIRTVAYRDRIDVIVRVLGRFIQYALVLPSFLLGHALVDQLGENGILSVFIPPRWIILEPYSSTVTIPTFVPL